MCGLATKYLLIANTVDCCRLQIVVGSKRGGIGGNRAQAGGIGEGGGNREQAVVGGNRGGRESGTGSRRNGTWNRGQAVVRRESGEGIGDRQSWNRGNRGQAVVTDSPSRKRESGTGSRNGLPVSRFDRIKTVACRFPPFAFHAFLPRFWLLGQQTAACPRFFFAIRQNKNGCLSLSTLRFPRLPAPILVARPANGCLSPFSDFFLKCSRNSAFHFGALRAENPAFYSLKSQNT